MNRGVTSTSRPSKKLVPSLSSDCDCSHSFRHDGELTLDIECGDCSGPQDIENRICAAGILNILARGVVPETVVLRRYLHIRYRLDCLRWMREVAESMAILRRMIDTGPGASDDKCRTCPASTAHLAAGLMDKIRSDPTAFAKNRVRIWNGLDPGALGADCPRAPSCIREVISALTHRKSGV